MIIFDVPEKGKSNRLTADLKGASPAAVQAIRSLISTRNGCEMCRSPREAEGCTHGPYTFAVEDFPSLGKSLERLEAPDINDAEITERAQDRVTAFFAERDRLMQVKASPADESLLEQIKGWKTKPFADQLQCIRFHIERGRSLEGGETGIGKTLILLYTFLYWKSIGKAKKGIILCLNSGKLDWEEEVKRHTNLTYVSVGNGTANVMEDLKRFEEEDADLLIIHYETLLTSSKSIVDVYAYLKNMKFDFMGIDEVHTLKNPTAKRHKRIMELLLNWRHAKVVCATGTAIDGNPKSAWATLKIVESRPDRYFPSYREFYNHFVRRQTRFFGGRRVEVEVGFKNLPRLKEWLEYTSIRFLKVQVTGRESKKFSTRLVYMRGPQLDLYKKVQKAVRDEITSEEGENVSLAGLSARTLRLRQIANHPGIVGTLNHYSGDSAKYQELDSVVEEVLSNPDAQILVWTAWRDAVDRLVQRYKKHGAIAFYGGSNDVEVRDALLSKKARIVIAIPEKAGTSVDFLKVCRTAVYLEKPWHLALYRQSLDRIDRRANTDFAHIISIECASSIDQVVNAVLVQRQQVFDALTLEDDTLVSMGKADVLKHLK